MLLRGLILRHLTSRPVRTLLTVGAFSVSIGLLGLLIALNEAFKADISPYTGQRVVVIAKTSFMDKLPLAYLAKIEATAGVERVIPMDFFVGAYRTDRPEDQIPVSSADAEAFLDIYREASIPKEQAAEWKKDPTGVVVGKILARKYGWKLGDRIVLKAPVKGGAADFTVRGIMDYDLDNGVYMHRRYFEGLTGTEGQAAMFWILARSRDDVEKISAALEKTFDNAPAPIRAMPEKQWQTMWFQMMGNVKALLSGIGLATAFALVLITSNTLAMAARERRGEAAILRILGFQRETVAQMLLLESVAYGLIGAGGGVALTFGFAKLLTKALEDTMMPWLGPLLVPNAGSMTLCLGLSLVLAISSSVVPALGLSRRSIVELLRQT